MKALTLFLLIIMGTTTYADTTLTTTEEFDAAGIKVIMKRAPNDVINVRFFIRGGTSNYSKEKEGIEALALNLITESGSTKYTKDQYHQMLERMGTSITANSTYDYSDVSMTCVKKFWRESWQLFIDVINHPRFDEGEFNRMKDKMIANAKQEEADPDSYVRKKALQYAFEGKDYEKDANGSVVSLTSITLDETKQHLNKIKNKSQCFVVFVGDMEKEDAGKFISKAFVTMPRGNYKPQKNEVLDISKSGLKKEEREIATNYMRGTLNAPLIGSDDEIPMRLAMSILNDRLFVEVRTKRNLSYAPAAFYPNLKNSYAVLYVSTTQPNEAVQVMLEEVKKIKDEGFTEKELENKKSNFLTRHYMNLETNSSQSQMLGHAEILGGWQRTETFVDDVYAVKLEDINRAADDYLTYVKWFYLGNPEPVKEDIFIREFKSSGSSKKKEPY